jgi:SNF2 family DNA or RNA helicase
MCPGHLVDKWMREIRTTLPQAKIVNLNNRGMKELFALKGRKPQGQEFYVIGKERAKMHYSWVPAVVMRGEIPHCPQCGKGLEDEKLQASLQTSQSKCPDCASPLWQADRHKSRRYAKAEYIKRYMPKGAIDLFVADEVHEYKGGNTAQGQALACLAASARRTLVLTGTLMGGYSRDLFYLLWRLFPELMKDKAPYRAEQTFAAQYGVLETIERTPLRDNSCSLGGQRTKKTVKEKPGVSPLLLTDFLLENTVFMRLRDISSKLPPYMEEVVGVQMLPEQADAYKGLEKDLRSACAQALACGNRSLLGALVNSLLAYPDGCRRGEAVIHPHTGQFVAGADPIEAALLPKEEKLLDLVQTEVSLGRKCLVCLEHTGTRDLIPTLADRLENVGINPLILRAGNPPVAEREKWIRAMMANWNYDVMIANPNLIKTGLDLIEFPTLVFFQTGYSIFTLRQASRRSWRIGQEQPVKVYYLNYLSTMQEKALALMASKMETALAVEGDLSDKGLVALAEGDNSILIELARTLVEQQEMPGLEETWQSYQQQVMQADAFLGDEQPVETVTHTTMTITQGERQATVTVTRVVRGKVYPKGKVGIGYVGERRLLFKGGQVFYKDRPVGDYDRTGKGQINGKQIKLEKDGNRFLLLELRPDTYKKSLGGDAVSPEGGAASHFPHYRRLYGLSRL